MAPKAVFYAVKKGKVPGVYTTWEECQSQVKGFPGADFKKFFTIDEAKAFASASHETTPEGAGFRWSYTEKPTNQAIGTDIVQDGQLIVYTDGACQGNGKLYGVRAGIGVWWARHHPRNLSERCPGEQTNNRAELIAIIRAVETAPTDSQLPLLIKTDSAYAINCMQSWLPKWERNGFVTSSGEPVKNQVLIQYLASLLHSRGGLDQFQHVRGHAGEEGNEGADHLATLGASKPDLEDRNWLEELATLNGRVPDPLEEERDEYSEYLDQLDPLTEEELTSLGL